MPCVNDRKRAAAQTCVGHELLWLLPSKHALREEVPAGQNSPAGIQQRHAKWPLTSKLCVALHQQDRQAQASRAGRRQEATSVSRGLLFWSHIVTAEERSVNFPSQARVAEGRSQASTLPMQARQLRLGAQIDRSLVEAVPFSGPALHAKNLCAPVPGPHTHPPTCFVSHSERTSCSTGIGSW